VKPPPFDYLAPDRLEDVLTLLAQHRSDARVLAGGQSLIPLMSLRMARYDLIIDLNRCAELSRIEARDGGVFYGAMVRQRDAMLSPLTLGICPLVAQALERAGPVAVRNRATVGGTLAHADRSAELPGVAMALDAIMIVAGSAGSREVPAREFFLGDMTTVIEADELLTGAIFPQTPAGAYTAFHEIGIRREGVALVGLAAMVDLDAGGRVRQARFAVTGVEPIPVRLSDIEAAIVGSDLPDPLIQEVGVKTSAAVDPMDDAYVTADYRRQVAGSLIKRALSGARSIRKGAA
jgi:CO/xanthine dehydrogenase FAD-binding subunit